MEIICIEKKTFEELVSRLRLFVKRMDNINRQRSGRRMSDWMDSQDVCQALKISPRSLQDYRNNGILPYHQLGGKSSIGKAILREYCEVAIVASFKLYPIRCKMKKFHYICTR